MAWAVPFLVSRGKVAKKSLVLKEINGIIVNIKDKDRKSGEKNVR